MALAVFAAVLLEDIVPSAALRSLLIFIVPMLCAGFIHLDGFMDVNDAVLSRRGIEERQRILKDSSIGAFAVITTVMLMISYFAAIEALLDYGSDLALGPFLIIPVISRGLSGLDVLTRRKIEVSQYAKTQAPTKAEIAALFIQLVIYLIAAMAISHSLWWTVLVVLAAEAVSILCFGTYARKSLGGMNGDIAGYEIVMAEVFGLIALAVVGV